MILRENQLNGFITRQIFYINELMKLFELKGKQVPVTSPIFTSIIKQI